MKKIFCIIIISALILITAFCFAEAEKKDTASTPEFSVRKVDEQTVLYSIYRGPYENIGQPIGKLYALAGQNGLFPKGSLSCVYLNNPQLVSKEHYLTEIRIPVDKSALKLAGTLGELTDVKTLPAVEMVTTKKPKGTTDQSPIYERLHNWLYKNGYVSIDNACEVFSSQAMTMSYEQTETEIMIPVKKTASEK